MVKVSRYDNVQTEVKDKKLVITIDLDEDKVDVQPSKSGKTLVYATTGGAISVGNREDGMKLNLTLYKK